MGHDPCECLNWKELYHPLPNRVWRFEQSFQRFGWRPPDRPADDSWPRLVCGEALEFFFLPDRNGFFADRDMASAFFAQPHIGGDMMNSQYLFTLYCEKFFHGMDNKYCVNMDIWNSFDGAQWCVVSDECKDLDSGERIPDKKTFYFGPTDRQRDVIGILGYLQQIPVYRNFWNYVTPKKEIPRNVSWKLCTRGRDKLLRDLAPKELFELASRMDAIVGSVTKMAWPRLLPFGQH